MNASKKIIAVFCSIAMSFSLLSVPAVAVTGEEVSVGLGILSFAYELFKDWKEAHPNTPDSEYPGFNPGGMYGGGVSRDELNQKYDDYVTTLPAPGYTSAGKLYYSPTHNKMGVFFSGDPVYCGHGTPESSSLGTAYFDCSSNTIRTYPASGKSSFEISSVRFYYKGVAPVDGTYLLLTTPICSGYGEGSSGQLFFSGKFTKSSAFYEAGATLTPAGDDYSLRGKYFSSAFVQGIPPVYEITPASSFSGDIYNINTRPTSITGGNYGIVGDNGQITKVEDNSTIINETNNTYYNPATGQTVPITGWTYDYSDRSYKVTMEGGKTSTVTYGDENISITETTVNESGDTITNNYTIYYLINGSETPVDPPAACEHTWTETSTTPATCTLPGSKLLTCSKCQQTKTETIPALGHNWQVKQTVTTQYDEGGNLTQEGYTIFECSRCHEQYKSTDGTAPPGGGSGTDPGGEEGETTIGGLIEKLLSGVGSIVGGIIKGLLSLLTKAVEALAGLAELFTTFVGSLVELWGGFTSFLSAVFPFLPEEFVIIIELGLILMIAAAVFRKFIS